MPRGLDGGWRLEDGGRGEGAGRFTMTHRGGREQGGVETFSDFPLKCEVVSAALVLDPVLLLSEVLVIQLSLDILTVLVHPGHLLHSESLVQVQRNLNWGFNK